MRSFVFTTFLCALSFSIYAQESKDSIFSLQEVKVTSSKSEVKLLRLPYEVNISTKREFEKNASRTIAESFFGLPGILIQKSNYGGGSPFLRGLTGNQNLIMVDGVRLNNSIFRYGPNQYLSLVEPSMIDGFEVLKGTGSVQFGSDAMTGVIYLTTKELEFQKKPQWHGSITNRITNKDMEFSYFPEITYQDKKIAFLVHSGKKTFGDIYTGNNPVKNSPSGYNEYSYDAKVKMDLGRNWVATAAYQFLQQNNVPSFYKYIYENYTLNTSDPIRRGMGYLKLNKSFSKGIVTALNIYTSVQDIREKRFLQKNANPILRVEQDQSTMISGGVEAMMTFNKHWKSTSGIDVYQDQINSSRFDKNVTTNGVTNLRGLYPNGSEYKNLSLFSIHHLQFGKLNAEMGLRYSGYKTIIHEATLGRVSTKPNAVTTQFGLNYLISARLALFSHMSEGFRAPNIDDMGTLGIVDFRYEIPAYDLRPEHSLNKEIGLKYFSEKLTSTISYFHISLNNLITRIKTNQQMMGYDVYIKENVDKGQIDGLEGTISWKMTDHLSMHGNYSAMKGFSATKNEPLRRIPPAMSRLSVEYGKTFYRLGVHFDHADPQRKLAQGDKDDIRIGKSGTEGFNVIHLYSGMETKNFNLRIYLNNVLNVKYKMHGSGIDELGRSFTISGRFSF